MAHLNIITLLKNIKCLIKIDYPISGPFESNGLVKITKNNSEKKYILDITFSDTGLNTSVKPIIIYMV